MTILEKKLFIILQLILVGKEKEWLIEAQNDADKSQKHYTEQINSNTKKAYIIWFHAYDLIVAEIRSTVDWVEEWGRLQKTTKEDSGDIEIFYFSIAGITLICTFSKIHQTALLIGCIYLYVNCTSIMLN